MNLPFIPKRWKVSWFLIEHRGLIREAIQETSNLDFFREIQYLYPKLEAQGIKMPSISFVNSDRWRNYHVTVLKDLDRQISKIEHDKIHLDLERWKDVVLWREESRDVLVGPSRIVSIPNDVP